MQIQAVVKKYDILFIADEVVLFLPSIYATQLIIFTHIDSEGL